MRAIHELYLINNNADGTVIQFESEQQEQLINVVVLRVKENTYF